MKLCRDKLKQTMKKVAVEKKNNKVKKKKEQVRDGGKQSNNLKKKKIPKTRSAPGRMAVIPSTHATTRQSAAGMQTPVESLQCHKWSTAAWARSLSLKGQGTEG